MENRKNIILLRIFIIVALLLTAPFLASAYGVSTHALLTQEIVKFARDSFPDLIISQDEEASMLKGSVEEDNGTRWLQHFYDPIHNRGLTFGGGTAVNPNLAFVGSAPIKIGWQSAKDWATGTGSQAGISNLFSGIVGNYFTGADDYSWDRAVYEYAWGNKARGLESLGHVLHLIEDSSVPDHTRNDPHPALGKKLKEDLPFLAKPQIIAYLGSHNTMNSSPYESFVSFGPGSVAIADTLKSENKKPVILNSLGNYFDDLAKYSNKNFFSQDTIFSEEYSIPEIVSSKIEEVDSGRFARFFYTSDSSSSFRLFGTWSTFDWYASINKSEASFISDPKNLILSSYWSLLSKQVVLHGAGVVKLFFDEVEKERQTKILYNKNRSWIGKGYDGVKQAVFGTASVLYGSSVTEQNLSENNPAEISPSPFVGSSPSQSPAVSPHIFSSPSPLVSPSPASNPLQIVVSTPTPQRSIKVVSQLPSPTPSIFNTGERGGGEWTGSQSSNQNSENKTVISPTPQQTVSDSSSSSSSTSPSPSPSPTPTPTPSATSDTQRPSLLFTIQECAASLSSDGCLIATTTMTLAWSSSDADIAHYKIECAANGTACSDFSFASTTATSTIYRAPADMVTYVFKATAVDASGNESAVQSISVDVSLHPVVINEIAWAGTGSSAAASKDEWIELYNPTSKNISLANMLLNSPSNSSFNVHLSGTIAPHGYYLIERTDDNAIMDIPADLVSAFGSGLSNSGEQLALMIGSTTIDKTPPAGACHDGWCAGAASGQYYTMERYDPLSSGEDSSNWGSWQNIVSYGTNGEAQPIKGTPKHRNSINYLLAHLSTNVPLSKTLIKANSPYVVASQTTIAPDAMLTIEPGVVIKFMGANSGLYGSGIILAQGTEHDPIIFTSFNDDSYAGDTNQNGTSTSPHAGDWGSVRLLKDGSKIDWAIVSYGGGDGDKRANVYVKDVSVDIAHSIIQESKFSGLFLEHASGSIADNTIQNNTYQQNSESTGLYAFDGDLVIRGNTFSGNIVGAQFVSGGNASSFQVENNNFINNKQEAASVSTTYPRFSGNQAMGNGVNGIVLHGNVTEDYSLKPDMTYVVQDAYGITSGKTLTLMPGVVVKLQQGAMIDVAGILQAKGTQDHPVVFTSFYDDDCSILGGCGDTDNGSTTPYAGDWFTIRFESSSGPSTLEYATIRFGGKSIYPRNLGAIHVRDGAALDVTHTTIEKNYFAGMRIENASPHISDSLIQDHRGIGGDQSYGLFLISSSTPIIQNTHFKNNDAHIYPSDSTSSYTDGGGNVME